jgi:hypothetical protein
MKANKCAPLNYFKIPILKTAFKNNSTVERASKKTKMKMFLIIAICLRKYPDCGMQYIRQIRVQFIPDTMNINRLSETTAAVKASF